MIRWVVTGPTGAGKSHLTSRLAGRGAAVVDGDVLGHEILARPRVAAAIAEVFGPGYVVRGAVDRPALGRLVCFLPRQILRRGPPSPRTCWQTSQMLAMPVAEIG